MIQIDIEMPVGCIYEGDNGKTEYCPLCNHDDVPYCQYLDDDEAALGIDERPCYCPLYKSEPQWIPCSERLPEKRQDVIVTVNDGMIYTDTDEWIGTGFFAYGHNVVAWQSLPDPWKGAEQ